MQGGKRQQTSAGANVCNMVETTAAALQTIEHGKAPACGFMPAGAEGLAYFDQEAMCACRHYAFIRRRMNMKRPARTGAMLFWLSVSQSSSGSCSTTAFAFNRVSSKAMSCVSGFASK